MSDCAYCHQDKGKRTCPALGGLISPSCCGQHRGLRIDCPSDCHYYQENEEIQRQRLSAHFHEAWLKAVTPYFQDRKRQLIDWIVFVEASIYAHFQTQTRGSDEDLIEALEYLKSKLSPISIIEAAGSGLGKHLEDVSKELLESGSAPIHEDAQDGVQTLIEIVQSMRDDEHERHALHGLLGHVEHVIGVPEGLKSEPDQDIETPKIITPGEM